MFTHLVFGLWFAGLVYFLAGLVIVHKGLAARGLDRFIALGPVFVAAPLATFAAEHFLDAHDLLPLVPAYLPARIFWVYFVGCALLAAATSILTGKFARLSSRLLGAMFLLFVFLLYLPAAIRHPEVRLYWILCFRETAFAGGAWALAGTYAPDFRPGKPNGMILFGRIAIACAVIFFGVDQMLHPQFTPGVPDTRLTPSWVPLHTYWGYPVGVLLLVAGIRLLFNIQRRAAATSIGLLMTLLVAVLYLPILADTTDPAQMTDAINFVADTLLFGGTALLLARGLIPIRQQGRYLEVE